MLVSYMIVLYASVLCASVLYASILYASARGCPSWGFFYRSNPLIIQMVCIYGSIPPTPFSQGAASGPEGI